MFACTVLPVCISSPVYSLSPESHNAFPGKELKYKAHSLVYVSSKKTAIDQVNALFSIVLNSQANLLNKPLPPQWSEEIKEYPYT